MTDVVVAQNTAFRALRRSIGISAYGVISRLTTTPPPIANLVPLQ
jgi:hypothetical protein